MATYARVLVQQLVLDAVGRWAERASGLRAIHDGHSTTERAPPYLGLEWIERPTQSSPRIEYDLDACPTSGLLTLTAAEGAQVAVVVNLARARLTRDVGEPLAALAGRVATELAPMLAGRVVVATAGAGVTLTPVTIGDLWDVGAVEGATASTAGEVAARVVDRVWRCAVRVNVIKAPPSSGQAGVAGDGETAAEIVAALLEALYEPWCQALFDGFGVRRVGEPTEAPARPRRANARLVDRSWFDLPLSITSRFALPPEPATAVVFALKTAPANPPDPPPEPLTLEFTIDADAD